MSEALDSQLKFTQSGAGNWWIASGEDDEYYYEADAAQATTTDGNEVCLQAIVDTDSSQTVKFYWKVSSEQSHDYLQFYIDGTLKDQISGEVAWTQKSYSATSGIHILKWRYVKDGSGYSGDDCGWVDFVQWTGPSPTQNPSVIFESSASLLLMLNMDQRNGSACTLQSGFSSESSRGLQEVRCVNRGLSLAGVLGILLLSKSVVHGQES
jgi:hypothetical protein